jgi:hypothetical protein
LPRCDRDDRFADVLERARPRALLVQRRPALRGVVQLVETRDRVVRAGDAHRTAAARELGPKLEEDRHRAAVHRLDAGQVEVDRRARRPDQLAQPLPHRRDGFRRKRARELERQPGAAGVRSGDLHRHAVGP